MEIVIAIVVAVVSIAIGFVAGFVIRKHVAEKAIGSAESEAGRIIEDAKKQAETKRKEGVIEAKEEALRIKNEAEAELKERRNEVSRLERRAIQKEENLDKKLESLEKKENTLEKKLRDNDALREEIERLRQSQVDELQRVWGMTVEDARATLLERVETDARHEMAQKLSEIEQQYKETADEKAKNIVTLAIQRCAADSVSEATVSVVDLPNDEMKGRIIGREGRNIRAIETLTGVDLIIDDTPEAITISSFDPVRREIARIALEKLISDGRIHPAAHRGDGGKSPQARWKPPSSRRASSATFETGVHGIHPRAGQDCSAG